MYSPFSVIVIFLPTSSPISCLSLNQLGRSRPSHSNLVNKLKPFYVLVRIKLGRLMQAPCSRFQPQYRPEPALASRMIISTPCYPDLNRIYEYDFPNNITTALPMKPPAATHRRLPLHCQPQQMFFFSHCPRTMAHALHWNGNSQYLSRRDATCSPCSAI